MRVARGATIKFVVFAVISACLMVILYNTMSNSVSGETDKYVAEFTDISGLRPGDDVRAAGVSVGRVEEVGVEPSGIARVDFTLSANQKLYRNTTMMVRYQNLLGQRYLALLPGKGDPAPVRPGEVIPASRTNPGFDLTALLNGFEPLFATVEPEEVNKLAGSIIAVMQSEGGTIETLLREVAAVSTDLNKSDKAFGQVLENLTPVMENLAAQGNEFDNAIGQFEGLMTTLAKERKTIGGSIDGVSDLSDATSDLVVEARPDVAKDIKSLRELAGIVVENREAIGHGIDVLPKALDAFARPMSHGSWLNIYLCNMAVQLPSGQKVNVGSADGPYTEACS